MAVMPHEILKCNWICVSKRFNTGAMQTDSVFAHFSLHLPGEFQKKKFTTGTLSSNSVALAGTIAHQRLSSFQYFHHGNKWTLPKFSNIDEVTSFDINANSAFGDCLAKPLCAHYNFLATVLTRYSLFNSLEDTQ